MNRELKSGLFGEDVAALHKRLVQLGFHIDPDELKRQLFGGTTTEAVRGVQRLAGLPATGEVDKTTQAALQGDVKLPRAIGTAQVRAFEKVALPPVVVTGRLFLDNGRPADSVALRFYQHGFGGETTRLKDVVTGADGKYVVDWGQSGPPANVEVRAVGPDGAETSLTHTVGKIATGSDLNLVAPQKVKVAPIAEYAKLRQDLKPHVADGQLGKAKENGKHNDLTLLQHATGWDTGVLKQAVTAERLAPHVGVEPQVLYGMMRVGLPQTLGGLAWVSDVAFGHALGKAVESGIVDVTPGQVTAAKAAFAAFGRKTRAKAIAPGTLSSFADMLGVAGLKEPEQARFDQLFVSHQGSAAQLWQAAAKAGLPADRMQLVSRLGFLTQNNVPLIGTLLAKAGTTADLPTALVKAQLYEAQAWQAQLTAAKGAIPPQYQGDSAAYAEDMAREVRLSFPTEIATHQVAMGTLRLGGDETVKGDLLRILSAPGFQLGVTPVSAFVATVDMPADRKTAALAQLRTLQRIHQISPSIKSREVLLRKGFTSAFDVTAMSFKDFSEAYGAQLGEMETTLIYRQAWTVTSTVEYSFAGARSIDTSGMGVPVVSAPAAVQEQARNAVIRQFPTMESLFGSMDYCECDHCRSVLSPAAYLVDLLKFLDPDPVARQGVGVTAYEALIRRRPDLPHLPLTCENTNTVMPYIDIVNEILECHVADNRHLPSDADTVWDTGDADPADLLAEPQQLRPDAYEKLKGAKFPVTAPFDLWWETVRRFTAHFDVPLWQLQETFGQPADTVRYERLGLSRVAQDTLFSPTPNITELYGGAGDLTKAKVLAERLGVSYKELVALVRTKFVNPDLGELATLRKLGISIEDAARYHGQAGFTAFNATERSALERKIGPRGVEWLKEVPPQQRFARVLVLSDIDAGCSFDNTILRYADGNAADPIAHLLLNLFVRLWRRLGWTIDELDDALTVFLARDPGARTSSALGPALREVLVGLSYADELSQRLKVSRRDVLRLWSPLDAGHYADLFLTGTAHPDEVFDDDLGRYLHTQQEIVAKHLPAVLAATRLTADETALILRDIDLEPGTAPLTIAVLSDLFRYRLLAKALQLSVSDFIALKGMSGIDPFATPQETVHFAEIWDALTGAGLSVTDLGLILGAGPVVVPQFVLLRTFATEIHKIRTDHAVSPDTIDITDDALRSGLALDLQAKLIRELVVREVAAEFDADEAVVAAFLTRPSWLDDPGAAGQPLLAAYAKLGDGTPSDLVEGVDTGSVAGWLEAPVTGQYRLFARCAKLGTRVTVRFDHLPEPLLQGTAGADAAEFSADIELTAGVMYRYTVDAAGLNNGNVVLEVHGERLARGRLSRLAGCPDATVAAAQRCHSALSRALLVVGSAGLTEIELRHMLEHRADFGGLDLGSLQFGQIMRLAGYVRLRKDIAVSASDLIGILAWARTSGLPELAGRFASAARCEPKAVEQAAVSLGLTPADFATEAGLSRLWRVLVFAGRFGVEPGALFRWATSVPGAAVARDLRDTIKARYPVQAWRNVAKSVFNPLRRLRRDALVSYIVHTPAMHPPGGRFTTLESLYEHFLVDPGTEPMVQTSRLRLAISSVQLFIQRCLLNLELEVPPRRLNAEHWKWMKRYRVWEANRKIFLYPENWLEPEFRDDKTHLFRELEGALLQSDLSNNEAEKALHTYLKGLEKIARLEIRSVWAEEKTPGNVLHVLARTYGLPSEYYYRTYSNSSWDPWIPVGARIDGDHTAVTVWRGRVYIFWVTFMGEPQGRKLSEAAADPEIKPKVQLHWSEYFKGEWTSATATEFLDVSAHLPGPIDPATMRVFASTAPAGHDNAGPMWITVAESGTDQWDGFSVRLASPNAVATVDSRRLALPQLPAPGHESLVAQRDYGSGWLSVGYRAGVRHPLLGSSAGRETGECWATAEILNLTRPATVINHPHDLEWWEHGRWLVSPFFLVDEGVRHTYFVEAKLTVTTLMESDDVMVGKAPRNPALDDAKVWTAFVVDKADTVQLERNFREPISPVSKLGITQRALKQGITQRGSMQQKGIGR